MDDAKGHVEPIKSELLLLKRLVKLDDQTTNLKSFPDGTPLYITIKNNGSIINQARKKI